MSRGASAGFHVLFRSALRDAPPHSPFRVARGSLPSRRSRSLVSGRPEESPLVVRVVRGSDVMERHTLALVELCIVGDDAMTDECITSIYTADDDAGLYEDIPAPCEEDDGTECMLDSMWNDWSEGLVPTAEEPVEEVPVVKKKKVAPWSSRSSPSGTYVRDPKTGKLVNIDE